MGKFFKFIGYLLIAIVILACLPVAIPKLMGFQEYNVISGSMEPDIPVGAMVYVKEVAFEDLAKGDIIAFDSGASVVTHRIVDIDSSTKLITTKGDANESNDFMPVAYTNVLGEVKAYTPVIGQIGAWLSDPIGKMVAVFLLIAGLLISSMGESSKKIKNAASDKKDASEESTPKKKTSKGPNPILVLALGLLIIFGACGGFLYIFLGYEKSNNLYESINEKYVNTVEETTEWYDMCQVDFDSLKAVNSDVVGWIYVEGTDISYPIMYSGDDEAYLRTTIDGQNATAGSIFLEGENSSDFSDSHSIIYGHNMRNLSMFGTLKYYKSEDNYLDQHKYFQVITPEGKMRFEIFSYFDTEPASWAYGIPYGDNEEFGEYISQLLKHSYQKIETKRQVTTTDKIVTLSTCSSAGMRFTLHGYMVEYH